MPPRRRQPPLLRPPFPQRNFVIWVRASRPHRRAVTCCVLTFNPPGDQNAREPSGFFDNHREVSDQAETAGYPQMGPILRWSRPGSARRLWSVADHLDPLSVAVHVTTVRTLLAPPPKSRRGAFCEPARPGRGDSGRAQSRSARGGSGARRRSAFVAARATLVPL